MRASHHDDNEEFEANSQQATSFFAFRPLSKPPSLVSINTGSGITSQYLYHNPNSH